MKNLFLFALLFAVPQSFAQKGIYLKPIVAVGISNTALSTRLSTANRGVTSYQAGISAGYQLNHLRIESGLQYFTAGAKLNGLIFENDLELNGGDVAYTKSYTNISERESYLAIPLRIGYDMSLGNKINLVPMAGIDVAYSLGGKYNATQYSNDGRKLNEYSRPYTDYDKVRTLAVVSVQAEYRLNRKIAVTAAPVVKYFIRDIGAMGDYRPNMIMLDAGLLYRF